MKDLILKQYKQFGYLLRYGLAGLTGGLVQEAVLYIWIDTLGLRGEYKLGVVLGFLCSLAVVFPLQKFWTFRDRSQDKTQKQFILYAVIAVGSLLGNVGLMHLFVGTYSMNPYLAQALTVAVIAGLSFLLNRSVTFSVNEKNVVSG